MSEVYDVAYPVGHSFDGDVEHYTALLADVQGRVLEPAVGNGRVLVPLLQAGVDVDGYDLSPAMVELCRDHCRARGLETRVEQADMESHVAPGAYAAVVVPAGSLVLLDGRAATLAALNGFRESLAPGGLLAVDVPAPEPAVGAELRTWESGSTTWTVQTLGTKFDAVANQLTHWLRYDRWDDGAHSAGELLRFRLQHWSLGEFTGLLTEAGFTDVTVTGDYAGSPRPDSGTWTFHARRD